jgi:hypothetical protein
MPGRSAKQESYGSNVSSYSFHLTRIRSQKLQLIADKIYITRLRLNRGIAKTSVMPAAVVPAAVVSGKPKAEVSKCNRSLGDAVSLFVRSPSALRERGHRLPGV